MAELNTGSRLASSSGALPATGGGANSAQLPTRPSGTQARPLPGSVLLAERMERSRFLRRASTSFFAGFVAVSSGTMGVLGFLASPAEAQVGPCCPSCCGPSPCCNTSCCSKPCCDSTTPWDCKNGGGDCQGYWSTWSGNSCWGCSQGNGTLLCCDCKTNNMINCPNKAEGVNRCICWGVSGFAPEGLIIIRDASQVPAGR